MNSQFVPKADIDIFSLTLIFTQLVLTFMKNFK